jgi:hypothetical protein
MREPRDVFRGIRWGEGSEIVTLLKNFSAAHLDCGFLPTRQKVETLEAVTALRPRLRRSRAPLTHAALRLLGLGQGAGERS